ncbi:hypothetical protein Pfo_024625 [Paulownia fortunei]|nr:hypothetical protein Pfo_024625 [Paulownia fortunei]
MVKKRVLSLSEEEKKKQHESRKIVNGDEEHCVSTEYERVRARRIKENMEKMRQLGINIINPRTRILKNEASIKSLNKKQPTQSHHLHPSMPRRASSRLKKKKMMSEVPALGDEICRDEGKVKAQEENFGEVYTFEHEKLLGDCNSPWPLFDDDNIKRLYDSVNGTTCHQCRQKTIGLRTECNLCHHPHGRLCGNCLYISKYGENLLEAKENGSWSCPVCRGICNCSRCREHKGWPPTDHLHNQAWKLGFKSVAHYLIQTWRAK